jgi:photosystem II stability/assembly factor-like uncharacterized protein
MQRKRLSRVIGILGGLLLLVLPLACSSDPNDPFAALEPGPAIHPQPDSPVWVVGAPDLVLHSADGGASWQDSHRSKTDIMTGDLWAIAFGDERCGWAVRRGIGSERTTVLATSDAGESWSWQYPRPQGKLLDVAAVGPRHAWAVGRRPGDSFEAAGLVIATADGGASWQRQPLPAHLQPFHVAFADKRHGWLLAGDRNDMDHYLVMATQDGGRHWRISFETTMARLTGIASVGAKRCWVIGYEERPRSGLLAMTRDGGQSWTSRGLADAMLFDVAFADGRHGWVVGAAGTVMATADGGASWTRQRADSRFSLNQVAFLDPKRGFILVKHTGLLATSDGGKTWTVVRPSEDRELLTGLCARPGS